MASQAPRPSSGQRGEGGREWERPRRFEAYPTIRTRMSAGMPGIPRPGRLPPVAIGAVALLLAAVVLFALPGLFAGGPGGGSGGGGGATPRGTASQGAVVTPQPPTPALPTPQSYIVKSGDTLSKIAKAFGFTIEEILAANPGIKDRNALQIGQVILIPSAFATSSPGPAGSPPLASGDAPTTAP